MSVEVRITARADLADGEARRFDLEGRRIAVVRIGDDVYAIGDRCSHADVSLSDGDVDADDCTLECPQHGSAFDLQTGAALTLPAVRPVPAYTVVVRDGDVLLTLDDPADGTSDGGAA